MEKGKTMKVVVLLVLLAGGIVQAAAVSLSSAVTADEVSITVPEGTWRAGERDVTIRKGGRFFVLGAGSHAVKDEPMTLSDQIPEGFWKGTKLQGPQPVGPINASKSFRSDTLVIRRTRGGDPLVLDKDYRVSAPYALVGLGPNTTLTTSDVVFASYQYSVHRLDSVVLNNEGVVEYIQGVPGVASVVPPEIAPDSIRLLNVFRPYETDSLAKEHLFFIEVANKDISTATTAGKIPKTLAKLKQGQPVTIVCLGDSVTVGADIMDPASSYVEQFRALLQKKFSPEQIKIQNISLGGSRSIQWLYKGDYKGLPRRPADLCDFQRVLDAKPDLVTIEFVNDMTLTREQLDESYGKIAKDLSAVGAEVILITPHLVHPNLMGLPGNPLRPADPRPLIPFLKEFSAKQNIGLADASARWEQSCKEGVPYITMLSNHFNHPDANGDRYFSQELMKCFSESP
jgi:hypothetical protein